MKTSLDPRHQRRGEVIKDLFRWGFDQRQKIDQELANKILKAREKIDQIIAESAPEWPIEQINRVDLAILRLAIFELVIRPKEPPKVVIDEAIELAKSYGGERSPSFINGVLGTVFKKYLKNENKSGGKS